MFLELTQRCQPDCADCAEARGAPDSPGVPGAPDSPDFGLELMRDLLPELGVFGVTSISLLGGEPVMHPRFGELLALLCRAPLALGLHSHGWHVPRYLTELAPYQDRIAHVTLTLRAPAAPSSSSAAGRDATRILEAIDAYRAAGYPVHVEVPVDRASMTQLLAVGERLASRDVTLHLRAPLTALAGAAWHTAPEASATLVSQIQALKLRLRERIALEPSVGFSHVYSFCSNFTLMDKVLLRADGEVLFCHRCRAGDAAAGHLGTLGPDGMLGATGPDGALGPTGPDGMNGATSATRQLGPILERHPAKVGAIWSARLAVMATTAPTASNNCEFCLEVLRSTSRA